MNLDANAPTGFEIPDIHRTLRLAGQITHRFLTLQKEISSGASPVTRWRFDLTIPNNEIAGVARRTHKNTV
jgi:hypothetical protein